jgi:hypothetical protein
VVLRREAKVQHRGALVLDLVQDLGPRRVRHVLEHRLVRRGPAVRRVQRRLHSFVLLLEIKVGPLVAVDADKE